MKKCSYVDRIIDLSVRFLIELNICSLQLRSISVCKKIQSVRHKRIHPDCSFYD